MNKKQLTDFLLAARTKTYAGSGGKVKPALKGSKQLEHRKGKLLYRDIYYTGNGIFSGIETIYSGVKPVWSMAYWGDFKKMTEEEVDGVLRAALIAKWKTARTWRSAHWKEGVYEYVCEPDFKGSIVKMADMEKIRKNKKQVYFLVYAGGTLVK